jgi:hypothetical protein
MKSKMCFLKYISTSGDETRENLSAEQALMNMSLKIHL